MLDIGIRIENLASPSAASARTPPPPCCAICAGAKEYVPLPPDAELIAAVLQAVTEEDTTFIARDPALRADYGSRRERRGHQRRVTVLITGESGTGKEVMARFIHRKSKRGICQFSFRSNCAAIPENMLNPNSSAMKKGPSPAPSPAVSANSRKPMAALDEISEM